MTEIAYRNSMEALEEIHEAMNIIGCVQHLRLARQLIQDAIVSEQEVYDVITSQSDTSIDDEITDTIEALQEVDSLFDNIQIINIQEDIENIFNSLSIVIKATNGNSYDEDYYQPYDEDHNFDESECGE
jgi:hypothetical protein